MNAKVLLLFFLLVALAEGESVTTPYSSTTTTEEEKEVTKDDGDSDNKTTDDLNPSESAVKYSFTKEDAKDVNNQQLKTSEDKDSETAGDDNPEVEALEVFEEFMEDNDSTSNATPKENRSDDDEDDDDDDDEDESNLEEEESNDKSLVEAKQPPLIPRFDQIQARKESNVSPNFELGEVNREDPRKSQILRERINSFDISNEGSPILQLTQGGYQRPFQRNSIFNNPRQRMRTGSESQQSETVEAPSGSIMNRDKIEPPQIIPQVSYSTPHHPAMNFGQEPIFHHPLTSSGMFNANGVPAPLQHGFFNTPPVGFTDFTAANFQSHIQPSNNGFALRDQNGIPLFTTPHRSAMQNPEFLFQNSPQFSHIQTDNQGRPVHTLLQPGNFINYPTLDNIDSNTQRNSYSPVLRHPFSNPQFQTHPNFYGTVPNAGRPDLPNPTIHLLPNHPNNQEGQSFPFGWPRQPMPENQITQQSTDQQFKQEKRIPVDSNGEEKSKGNDNMKTSQDVEDPAAIPFGARIMRQNNNVDQPNFLGQRDVYLRYPLREAGYATEENLPLQNTTENSKKINDPATRLPFPFYSASGEFRGFSHPDPYRNALNSLRGDFSNDGRKKSDDSNRTEDLPSDQLARNEPSLFDPSFSQPSNRMFPGFINRRPETPSFEVYPVPKLNDGNNPFNPLVDIRGNYDFMAPRPSRDDEDALKSPICAQGTNASFCFEDANYPRREVLYALNSDTFLMERLTSPNQVVEEIALVDQNSSEAPENKENYVCKSDIKYGLPLRAKNVQGVWKVIVNMEKGIANGKFMQSIRLEVCRGANEPCNFTQVATACVQKYNLQRLLVWSPQKGLHNDVFKVPIACSCQILETKE